MPEQTTLPMGVDDVLLLHENLKYTSGVAIVSYKVTKPATRWYCDVTVSYEDASQLYSLGRNVGIDREGRGGI